MNCTIHFVLACHAILYSAAPCALCQPHLLSSAVRFPWLQSTLNQLRTSGQTYLLQAASICILPTLLCLVLDISCHREASLTSPHSEICQQDSHFPVSCNAPSLPAPVRSHGQTHRLPPTIFMPWRYSDSPSRFTMMSVIGLRSLPPAKLCWACPGRSLLRCSKSQLKRFKPAA